MYLSAGPSHILKSQALHMRTGVLKSKNNIQSFMRKYRILVLTLDVDTYPFIILHIICTEDTYCMYSRMNYLVMVIVFTD